MRSRKLLFIIVFIHLQVAVQSLDYNLVLKHLHEDGLISERVKRSIQDSSNHITGVQVAGCPFAVGSSSSHDISKRSLENHLAAENVLSVITDLSEKYGPEEALERVRRSVDFRQLSCLDGWAPCDENSKYRTIDGRCNNLDNPTWGSALIPQLRYMAPAYDDKIGSPRQYTANGTCLPKPRDISKAVHMSSHHEMMKMSGKHSLMLMLWGQFLDHDITLTPQRETLTSCCTYDGVWRSIANTGVCRPKFAKLLRQSLRARSSRRSSRFDRASNNLCMALEVNDDTFGFGHTCIDFQRSIAVPSNNCHMGYREQLNQITAFIDGSQIYGSTVTLAWALRSQVNGSLNTSGHNFLPVEDSTTQQLYNECIRDSKAEHCFKAGDIRVNVQPGLSAIHTLFMKEHNRIASVLLTQLPVEMNSRSPLEIDEFVYQETRRIVAAMLQHITYNEFLPVLLGKTNVRKYNLLNNKSRRSRLTYSPSHQPSIRNEFAAFAFRIGHSLVPHGLMPLNASYGKYNNRTPQFDNLFMNPHLVYRYGVGDILRGVITEPIKEPGADISEYLERTFRHSNRTTGGLDLAAVNIQRGRDHGIPSYTALRKHCRLSVPTSFDELDMPEKTKENLATVYGSVEDIDAWTGAISEFRMPRAMVGRLNACIIGRQFRSLRRGDRFWYEFQEPNVGFSNGQLEELYNTTLASIMCDNLNMATVQPQVFYLVQWNQLVNKRTSCNNIPRVNLDNWFNK